MPDCLTISLAKGSPLHNGCFQGLDATDEGRALGTVCSFRDLGVQLIHRRNGGFQKRISTRDSVLKDPMSDC